MITFSYKKNKMYCNGFIGLANYYFLHGMACTYIGLPVSIILAAVLVFSTKSTDERKNRK